METTGNHAFRAVEKPIRPLSLSRPVSDQQASSTWTNVENPQVFPNLNLISTNQEFGSILLNAADSMKEVAKLISSDLSKKAEMGVRADSESSGLNDSGQ
ncbi:hypothetical protein PVK06_009067 [Gossypium arboreum]|uniref:Uncharacterized protein n=1 Tax=Gossypium arboreum TaxID=29729 RepID=A0ABR0QMN7_GOSAR|nr:hypothetical protein PVK06_009067 [Gossypium arboreum]